MADKFENYRANPDSLTRGVPTLWSVGNTDLPANAKAVFFDADGTITVDADGGGSPVSGIVVVKGITLPFIPPRITAMSGPTACWIV